MSAAILFPHQLFWPLHPAIEVQTPIILIEDPLFFGDEEFEIPFHKQKLILHRASMKAYADELKQYGYLKLEYIEHSRAKNWSECYDKIAKKHTDWQLFDVVDDHLRRRLEKAAQKNQIQITWWETPNFLTPLEKGKDYFAHHSWSLAPFYTWQRKRLEILVDENQKPVGGRWSFDMENRQKLPKNSLLLPEPQPQTSSYVTEAKFYVETHFALNPGQISSFFWPVSRTEAEQWLEDFLAQRLQSFGPYEDAISSESPRLFHSMLSSSLNIGLLSPIKVVETTMDFAAAHSTPLNSLEGFIRQLIGWREYIRLAYEIKGRSMRLKNTFGFQHSLPKGWWDATTGIEPIDHNLQKIGTSAYTHHIERLMVLGNFLLLTETNPELVYQWFMSQYIDAYDWVMVPNVYGMSQFADGGMIMTKPYISGSRYVLSMSNYHQGDWTKIWDSLYWNFVNNHQELFSSNPRTTVIVSAWHRMSQLKRDDLVNTAQAYLLLAHASV